MSAGILYLHGFCSSRASRKARLLAEAMADRGLGSQFFCPALSPVPALAIEQASALLVTADPEVTLVGSSLGGLYATVLAERLGRRALLVNPAVGIAGHESLLVGWHENFYTGASFEFTREHAAQLIDLERMAITPANYQLWAEQGDEVLDWQRAVARYAGCVQRVFPGGDHSFTRFGEMLPQLFEFCGL